MDVRRVERVFAAPGASDAWPCGYGAFVDVLSLALAPIRLPVRLAKALDDLTVLADRARRDPDPVEEVRERLDRLLSELHVVLEVAQVIARVGENLDVTGRQIVVGGRDLTLTAKTLERDTRELIDGGAELTEVSRRIETDLQAFRALLPRIVDALDTVERLEDGMETVTDTVEPLQGAAERVGRVTRRLSR